MLYCNFLSSIDQTKARVSSKYSSNYFVLILQVFFWIFEIL